MTTKTESLLLKWGTLKGWHFAKDNEPALKLLKEYHESDVCWSVIEQRDTPRQKEITAWTKLTETKK